MENKIIGFNNNEFGNIRTIEKDGVILFCGKDVAESLGYVDTKKAIERHCKKNGGAFYPLIDNLGREQQAKFIDEGNLYRLIINSKLPTAEKFEAWIFEEVLPSIRKNGAYVTTQKIEDIINNPDNFIKLLTTIKQEREEKEILKLELKANEPKVEYFDLILQSTGLLCITQIAKDYGMSAVGFNKMLFSIGIQYKVGKQWVLYSKYQKNDYTHSVSTGFDRTDGRKDANITTKWTQKGRLFLYNILKENQILPQIEMSKNEKETFFIQLQN